MLGKEKTVEHESDGDTNCNWCSWYSHQRIATRIGGFGNSRTSGDHPNYCIIELGQNTEKSPENLRRLAVTQIPVRNHQLTLVWKTQKEVNNNDDDDGDDDDTYHEQISFEPRNSCG